jgi:hypothetical protein
MPFRVEVRYAYGWDDAGWTEDTGSGPEPLRFPTRDAAMAALAEFFKEVRDAVAVGYMDVEERPDNYRVIEVKS